MSLGEKKERSGYSIVRYIHLSSFLLARAGGVLPSAVAALTNNHNLGNLCVRAQSFQTLQPYGL